MKILVPVDGSKPSLKAVQLLVEHCDWYREQPQIELLAVHLPVPKVAHTNKAQLERYYQEEGQTMLTAAKKKLDGAGIACATRILVGPVAETIVKHAKAKGFEMIYIGTRGMGALGQALLGSTATKVVHIAETPVLLVR